MAVHTDESQCLATLKRSSDKFTHRMKRTVGSSRIARATSSGSGGGGILTRLKFVISPAFSEHRKAETFGTLKSKTGHMPVAYFPAKIVRTALPRQTGGPFRAPALFNGPLNQDAGPRTFESWSGPARALSRRKFQMQENAFRVHNDLGRLTRNSSSWYRNTRFRMSEASRIHFSRKYDHCEHFLSNILRRMKNNFSV